MTGDLLRQCGEALYGPQWRSPLARDLDVALRTMQRWAAGEWPVPPGVWPRMFQLLSARQIEIRSLRRQLADELVPTNPAQQHNARRNLAAPDRPDRMLLTSGQG